MPAQVTLYSLEGCHLCDDARPVLADACAAAGVTWSEVDIRDDQDAAEKFADMVPVVVVDGEVVGYWRLDPERLRAALGV